MTDEEAQEIRERLLPVAKAWRMGADVVTTSDYGRGRWDRHTAYTETNEPHLYFLGHILNNTLSRGYAYQLAKNDFKYRIAGSDHEYRAAA